MGKIERKKKEYSMHNRRLIIPRMSTVGAESMAAAFKSMGIQAEVSPPSDERTLPLAAQFTTGEECLPQRITLGNFLKVIHRDDFDPSQYAFFIPTSSGPCRFGQYASFLRKVLQDLDYSEALVYSPTSSDGYEGITGNVMRFKRTAWRAIVVSDILRKVLFMVRPYVKEPEKADAEFASVLSDVCRILADPSLSLAGQMERLVGMLENGRDRFLRLVLSQPLGTKPLIGVVGEIFLRLNSYSNQQIVRRIEKMGGEVWMADISEWIWYTNLEQERKLRDLGKRFSLSMAGVKLKRWIQKKDEATLLGPFQDLFKNRMETPVESLLTYSYPYLPSHMALGEMTLNTGKAIAFYKGGCDGVIDVSPFTCMNGIVTEAIYPHVSYDFENIPIRIFYFDGVPFDLDTDLEIFMSLAKSYRHLQLQRSAKA